MNNFELLDKHISEIDEVLDTWIEQKFLLNYNHFAVLYCLVVLKMDNAHKSKFVMNGICQNKPCLIFAKNFEKKDGLNFIRVQQINVKGLCN